MAYLVSTVIKCCAKCCTICILTSLLFFAVTQSKAENSKEIAIGLLGITKTFIQPGIVMTGNCNDGSALIDKMLQTTSTLNNYSSDYEIAVHKTKTLVKEKGRFYFRKPRLLRVEVTYGPKKGALAILSADGKIHGHLGGLKKYFTGSVSGDSDLAKAINGYPMAATDFYSLSEYLKNMLKSDVQSTCSAEPILTSKAGIATYILDMYEQVNKNNHSQKVLLKRIYINPQSYLPVFWEDYIKGQLWSESIWQNLQLNCSFSDRLFKV